jgi:hypothetical protein
MVEVIQMVESGGFKLKSADAAYVDWALPNMPFVEGGEDCGLSLAIGYVKAKKLEQPFGTKGHPHSDLAARLTGNCATPAQSWDLQGVLPLIPTEEPGCSPTPSIEKLASASVICTLTLEGSTDPGGALVTAEIYIDLGWTAFGDAINENFSIGDGHSAKHKRKRATVTGFVQILSLDAAAEGSLLVGFRFEKGDVLVVFDTSTTPDDITPAIIRYNEKQEVIHH